MIVYAAVLLMGFMAGYAAARLFPEQSDRRSIVCTWLDGGDLIVHTAHGSWRGSSTVWHDADTGQRASTSRESWLADIYTRELWHRESEG